MNRQRTADPVLLKFDEVAAKSTLSKRAGELLRSGRIDRSGFDRCIRHHLGTPVMKASPAEIRLSVDAWASRDAARIRGVNLALARGKAALQAIIDRHRPGAEASLRKAAAKASAAIPPAPIDIRPGAGIERKVVLPDWDGGRAG